MKRNFPLALFLVAATAIGQPVLAQQIEFKGLQQDSSLPVEVAADSLAVDQTSGLATFDGNVVVVQGDMTIKAGNARVEYAADGTGIAKLYFSGRVTFAGGTEAAQADEAVYTVAAGEVVMTGDVLLTQGSTTIAGQKMVYDLQKGTGKMEGRVQTSFTPKSAAEKKAPKATPTPGAAP
ncbi:lipopolysaccharide transport periplasmic protein LptA [Paragemmobacter straminiformis]|uniref:Lipopolysaccharide transport periplasmic protein LptA n=1 Tax=Paragemmobacter straminiformis TaxID=2045119 RepID=A0A842I5R2_9RHOB|nr:lipopolysaccharide transport periplasmic protein LptA [Gemmobacter straminiformis]MBC2834976.1 lipopolysaccharide transport periplasmic protein LptA [Gemmobacter straminiformis]